MILRPRLPALRLGVIREICDTAGPGEGRADLSLKENFRGLVVKEQHEEEKERNGYEEGS